MSHLALLLCLFLQESKPAPIAGAPAAAGIYFRQAESQWQTMEAAAMADMKSKGISDFINTAGYTNLAMVVTYRGVRAGLQIPAAKPAFFVRGAGSAKDAMIIALAPSQDTRSVRTDSAAASVGNRAGFRKEDIRNVTATIFSDGSFLVTPDDDLKPGEYALVFGFPNTAYDFGITRSKK